MESDGHDKERRNEGTRPGPRRRGNRGTADNETDSEGRLSKLLLRPNTEREREREREETRGERGKLLLVLLGLSNTNIYREFEYSENWELGNGRNRKNNFTEFEIIKKGKRVDWWKKV